MRIGITTLGCDSGRSGIGKYAIALLRELPRIAPEHEFVVAVAEGDRNVFTTDAPNVTFDYLPAEVSGVRQSLLWHLSPLNRWVRKHRLDRLFLPAGNRRLPWSCPCPTIGTVHDLSGFHIDAKYDVMRMLYIKRVLPLLIRRLNRIITVSTSSDTDIENFTNVETAKITIIANGYDPTIFNMDIARHDQSDNIGAPYWLYLSRIEHPGKNHVALIEAYEQIAAKNPSTPELVFAGGDWDGAGEVHARHERSPFRNRIRFAGYVSDSNLPSLVAGAEACVYPSLYEGFGIPLIEAMACGVPVVCSDTSSLPEVAGDAALFFDPSNPQDIARALTDLPNHREALIKKGLKRVERFTWRTCAESTLEVILAADKEGRN